MAKTRIRRKRGAATEAKEVAAKLSPRDKKTMTSIVGLADRVVDSAEKRKDPHVDIPSRTLSNVRFSPRKGIIEMGNATNRRHAVRSVASEVLHANHAGRERRKKLLTQGKTTSLRGLFYMLKHTIEGTKENTFDDQSECDPVVEDIEVLLNTLREELHLYASNRGTMVGPITLVDSGDTIDCSRMGSGGYSIPSIVEPEVIQFVKCDAKFILHVEKDTVWRRFNEDKFWKKHNCLLTHGMGQPPRGVRRMLNRLHFELKLPIYCLLDNDPWGYYIYSVIKQGSINLAYESQRMAIPDVRYLGLRSRDFERCQLSDGVKITLNDSDRKRAKQIAGYPWFAKKREWQREIQKMLQNDFKLEVESLISKDISYVTEEYVPARLTDQDWLD